jgi:hypothetical protein
MRTKTLLTWTDSGISAALLALGVVTILVALFVKNRWIKAGILAWEVLP